MLFENAATTVVAPCRKAHLRFHRRQAWLGREVISYATRARRIDTIRVRADPRARRGRSFWRCNA